MDIEEGEILISDVSSDEDKECQPQPCSRDRFRVLQDRPFYRYHNISQSNSISSPQDLKRLHNCSEDSFCRKTFRVCLVNPTSERQYNNRFRNRRGSIRDGNVSNDFVSRTTNQKQLSRPNYKSYPDHNRNHESHKSKKRKRKRFGKNRPTPDNSQYQYHCESRSTVTSATQLSSIPSSTVVTHENTSLMQKLITSGLAKPPNATESSSEMDNVIKKEITISDNVESKDYSDDSEIEVIIPPKKIPPLVTLDSDGEEMEQLSQSNPEKDKSCTSTLDDNQNPPLNVTPATNEETDVSNNLALNKNGVNENLDCIEVTANGSPISQVFESNDSPDSLSSELCMSLSYSPSSPSSVSGCENNITSNLNRQSSVGNNKRPAHFSKFESDTRIDCSSASSEEISSEIWLDQTENQNSGNLENNHSPESQIVNQKETDNKARERRNSLSNENSLSVLVEDFIMMSTTTAKEQQQDIVLIGESNATGLETNGSVSNDDQEPYSPSSEYSYKPVNDKNSKTFSTGKESTSYLIPKLTLGTFIPKDNCIETITPGAPSKLIVKPVEPRKDQVNLDENNRKQHNIDDNENDEDNVSQLRMIALQTKKKTTQEETQSDSNDKSTSQTALDQIDEEIAEPESSEAPCGLNEDDDVLQLRVAALKSAVMKKYGERKKKGLVVKKRKRAPSGFGDDIFSVHESNTALDQENTTPLSPNISSTSVQGEEDMELAESDLGEDVIEELPETSVVEKPKLFAPVHLGLKPLYDSSVTHSVNSCSVVPPQPLPPGVDGDCPEMIDPTILRSVLPPPPPPPLLRSPPPLTITSMLHPPPPPPFPSHSKSEVLGEISNQLNVEEEFAASSSLFGNRSFDNESDMNQPNFSNRMKVDSSKKSDSIKTSLRNNLITVDVVKNVPKKVPPPKKKRRRKVRKEYIKLKAELDRELDLLCITKPPGKSTTKSAGSANLTKNKQGRPSVSSGYGKHCETSPEKITPKDYESSSPIVLCKTDLPADNWTDGDNSGNVLQKQQHTGIDAEENFNFSDESPMADNDIDLSDMIVLDEVGMSPEHKSKYDSTHDYSFPYEDEDEDTLRIRALTSLSPKPLFKTPTTTPPQNSYPQTEPYGSYQGNKEYTQRKILAPGKPKEVIKRRKVVGETSKYRLTRMSNDRRSVLHGKETLKVVVPTNSQSHAPVEQSLPVVQRLVINVNKDSDSEEECEWTRKIRIQETNTLPPLGPVVDYELERSIDELLMRARNSSENVSSRKSQDVRAQSFTQKRDRRSSTDDDSLHGTPMKLLPIEKQEEYKRLKAILEQKERERRLKRIPRKATETSKSLLKQVLTTENNKQIKENSNQNIHSRPNSSHGDLNLDERILENYGSSNPRNVNVKEDSISSGFSDADEIISSFHHEENIARRLNSDSHNVQNEQLKSSDQKICVPTVNLITDRKIETDSKNLDQSQRATNSDSDESRSKRLSVDTTTAAMKEKSENLSGQRKIVSSVQKNNATNRENISSYELEMNKENSPKISCESQSSSTVGNFSTTGDFYFSQTTASASGLFGLNSGDIEPCSRVNNCDNENNVSTKETLSDKVGDVRDFSPDSGKSSVEHFNRHQFLNPETRCEIQVEEQNAESNSTENIKETPAPEDLKDSSQSDPKPCSQEELGAKKSELLSERFGLLDDLSEMTESLDDLDSQQRRLEQAVVDISELRRALHAAEDSLHKQLLVAKDSEQRLRDTHSAVNVRCSNIIQLETTLHRASFEIPTTAQKLMTKKVKQVKEKMDKVREGRSIIKSLIHNPDITKEELTEMHANLLEKNSGNSEPDVEDCNILWLQDPNEFMLDDLPLSYSCDTEIQETNVCSNVLVEGQVLHHLKVKRNCQKERNVSGMVDCTASELIPVNTVTSEDTVRFKTCDTSRKYNSENSATTFDVSISSESSQLQSQSSLQSIIISKHAEDSGRKSKECTNEELTTERCAKSFDSEVTEETVKIQNLVKNNNTCNKIKVCDKTRNIPSNESGSGNSGQRCHSNNSGSSKSKLKYKSILQFRHLGSSADKGANDKTILCPYDLTGRCQDKACKYQHLH
ncbi:uncharacterized protein LOC128990974 [Macrosteles quadrilineatus]|uniref:uncharacterized protein LOC128990974 n=1 Tax=Macrosteles quadrilineatus TaxID=74068 RepID=UPI0023E2AAF9|nr:uncharacterized protein LOC128990974 [Macrosteles quadrilineatus]